MKVKIFVLQSCAISQGNFLIWLLYTFVAVLKYVVLHQVLVVRNTDISIGTVGEDPERMSIILEVEIKNPCFITIEALSELFTMVTWKVELGTMNLNINHYSKQC